RSFSQTRTAADSAGSEVLPATASEASRLRAQSLVSWESIIALPCQCAATLNIEAWKNATPFSAPRTGAAVKVRQPLCFRRGVKRSAGGKEWRDHPAGTSEELMAKKSQKSKRRCDELPILHVAARCSIPRALVSGAALPLLSAWEHTRQGCSDGTAIGDVEEVEGQDSNYR